jgi:1-acyl-sn-glycerol-3-phosphate acyltransferase
MKNVFIENLNYLKSIIHWIIWWIVATSVIVLLIGASVIIPKIFWDACVKISCRIMTFTALLFPRIKGYDVKKLPFPVIFVANHVSFFDLFISGAVLPGHPRGFELYHHFNSPIYGWFIRRFGQIPIEAGNRTTLKKAITKAIKILNNKERNIYVAPEGTRTRDGKIKNVRGGAFYLSYKTGVPIVPVVYKNLFRLNNKNSFLINPGFFDAIILPPVYPDDFSGEEALKLSVKKSIENELAK